MKKSPAKELRAIMCEKAMRKMDQIYINFLHEFNAGVRAWAEDELKKLQESSEE